MSVLFDEQVGVVAEQAFEMGANRLYDNMNKGV
jgi:hypothetical protein